MTCFLCCRCLATGDSFKTIAYSFHVGVSTVSKIVPDVVTAIWDCLMGEFMALGERFEEQWNLPLCCGAQNGKCVILKAPINSGFQYNKYKGTLSLVLLEVVDDQFWDRWKIK